MTVRVLHVMPSLERRYGGPVSALLGFLEASHAAGIDTGVVAPRGVAAEVEEFRALAPHTEVRTFAVHGPGVLAHSPALAAWVRSNGATFGAVHVHGLLNAVSSRAARAALRAKRPLVICPFGTLSRYTALYRRRALKRLAFRLLEYPNLRRASAIHFTTAAERDEAEWHGLGLGSRAFVIPPPWSAASAARNGFPPAGTGESPPTALFLSRWHPVKRLERLLDAWVLVRQQLPGARLVIAGDGDGTYAASVRARAEQLGGERLGIVLPGFVTGTEKARYLCAARVFVLPSLHENFGMVVLEALAAGVPVVVTPEVQLQSFVRAHGLGTITDGSVPELAEAIVATLTDDTMLARVRRNGPTLVAREFAPAAVGRQLREMYEAIGRPPDAAR